MPPLPTDLDGWLAWQDGLHTRAVDLGLERVHAVFQRLHAPTIAPQVITVAGTNGKGSCVALFEAMLLASGVRCASYTSPHLLRWNERVRVQGQPVEDAMLCRAFARVEQARQGDPLTPFEFGTLAALWLIAEAEVEVAILEVGLGGRLDAVNIIDADIALITRIGLDHCDWLGPDRESIACEKIGIARAGRPVVCLDRDMPERALACAEALGASVRRLGQTFDYTAVQQRWRCRGCGLDDALLPPPVLSGAHQVLHAAGVVYTLNQLALLPTLPVVQQALRRVNLPGRLQRVQCGAVEWLLDVAHNPMSIEALTAYCRHHPPVSGRTVLVLAMMADKDVESCIEHLSTLDPRWLPAALPPPRGCQAAEFARLLRAPVFADPTTACQAARALAHHGDRVLVTGSFATVTAALHFLRAEMPWTTC